MIGILHALVFVINELSTPVWQLEVRQITYQVVEAMREAASPSGTSARPPGP